MPNFGKGCLGGTDAADVGIYLPFAILTFAASPNVLNLRRFADPTGVQDHRPDPQPFDLPVEAGRNLCPLRQTESPGFQ